MSGTVRQALLRTAVGPRAGYYLRAWDRIAEDGEPPFNAAAGLLGPLWLAYRRMYVHCGLYLLGATGLAVVLAVLPFGAARPWIAAAALGVAVVVVGSLANEWYRRHVARLILQANGVGDMELYRQLLRRGGVRVTGPAGLVAMSLLVVVLPRSHPAPAGWEPGSAGDLDRHVRWLLAGGPGTGRILVVAARPGGRGSPRVLRFLGSRGDVAMLVRLEGPHGRSRAVAFCEDEGLSSTIVSRDGRRYLTCEWPADADHIVEVARRAVERIVGVRSGSRWWFRRDVRGPAGAPSPAIARA